MHPVFFGSAITGAGVEQLMAGLAELLPATAGDVDGPVSARVFKIERGRLGPEGRIPPSVLRHGADQGPTRASVAEWRAG